MTALQGSAVRRYKQYNRDGTAPLCTSSSQKVVRGLPPCACINVPPCRPADGGRVDGKRLG